MADKKDDTAAKPTLLDTVNAALEPVIAKDEPEAPEEKDEVEDEEEPAEKPEGDEATVDEAEEGGEKPPKGEETDPEKPVKKDGDGKPSEGEEKPPKEPKELKPIDPINDPIPQQVSERTRERITSLVAMVKDRDTNLATQQELFTTIKSTGVSPENFAQTLSFLRLFNSEQIEDRRQAYNFMLGQLQHLAGDLGEVLPGTNPLETHKDLTDEVAAGKLTQERAIELATVRNRTKATETARTTTTTRQQEEQAFETARQTAIGELNTLQVALQADPNYARKHAILVPALRPVMSRLHPSHWKATFEHAYRDLVLPAAAPVAPRQAAKTNGQQPLRANKQPSGEGSRQPTSMADAISAALKELSG